MPPRFAYWTILIDDKPTAFRAAEQEELLPTFKRLQEKNPNAVMRWFSRGRLWASPDEARAENARRAEAADTSARGRNWRPGGSHSDPRQPYMDAKKNRNQERRQRRFEFREKREHGGGKDATRPPAPDRRQSPPEKRESNPGKREFKPWDKPKAPFGGPHESGPRGERKDGPGDRSGGWTPRPPRSSGDRPFEARPPKKDWSKPPTSGPRESGPGKREFKPWNDRPKPAGRWPRDERKGGPGDKPGGWTPRPPRSSGDRPFEARPPKKDWSKPPASGPREPGPGKREFKPWNDRPKPAGRWPRDERKGGPGDKPGGWTPRPPRSSGDRPFEARPPKKDWSKPPASGPREPGPGKREFKPWNDRPKPAGRWPRDERKGGPGDKPGGWTPRPPRSNGDRPFEARPPKKDWSKPPASGKREFKPWDKPKAPFRVREGGPPSDGPRGKPRGPKR